MLIIILMLIIIDLYKFSKIYINQRKNMRNVMINIIDKKKFDEKLYTDLNF